MSLLLQVLALLQNEQHKEMAGNYQILVGTLEAELEPLVLSKAAQYGLPVVWVNRLAKLDPERRQVPSIRLLPPAMPRR